MSIWKELGIQPTSDISEIKKAYARRSRECHPEEAPEQFQQLYQAYQMALKHAKRNLERERRAAERLAAAQNARPETQGQPETPYGEKPKKKTFNKKKLTYKEEAQHNGVGSSRRREKPVPPIEELADRRFAFPVRDGGGPAPQPAASAAVREQVEFDFDHLIGEGLSKKERELECQRKEGLDGLRRLLADPDRRYNSKAWQEYLQSAAFTDIMQDPQFLQMLEQFLQENQELPTEVWLEFYYAYDLYKLEKRTDQGKYEGLLRLLYPRYKKYAQEQKEKEAEEERKKKESTPQPLLLLSP